MAVMPSLAGGGVCSYNCCSLDWGGLIMKLLLLRCGWVAPTTAAPRMGAGGLCICCSSEGDGLITQVLLLRWGQAVCAAAAPWKGMVSSHSCCSLEGSCCSSGTAAALHTGAGCGVCTDAAPQRGRSYVGLLLRDIRWAAQIAPAPHMGQAAHMVAAPQSGELVGHTAAAPWTGEHQEKLLHLGLWQVDRSAAAPWTEAGCSYFCCSHGCSALG